MTDAWTHVVHVIDTDTGDTCCVICGHDSATVTGFSPDNSTGR